MCYGLHAPSSHVYDAATMATIKAAFHDVWDTIEGQDLMQVAACDEDLKAVIIRRLTDLVAKAQLAERPEDKGPQQPAARLGGGLYAPTNRI